MPIHTRDFIIQTKPIKSNKINDHYLQNSNTQLNKPKATQVLSVKSYQPATQPVGPFKCYFMHG